MHLGGMLHNTGNDLTLVPQFVPTTMRATSCTCDQLNDAHRKRRLQISVAANLTAGGCSLSIAFPTTFDGFAGPSLMHAGELSGVETFPRIGFVVLRRSFLLRSKCQASSACCKRRFANQASQIRCPLLRHWPGSSSMLVKEE